MQISIQPLVDLLLYHRQGDNNFFKKLVEQWLSFSMQHENLTVDISRAAYDIRLNFSALGFIDIYQFSEIQRWSSIGSSVINLAERGSILFLHQYQIDQMPSNAIQQHTLFSLKAGRSRYINLTIPHTFRTTKLNGVSYIKPDFYHLLNFLPKIAEAIHDNRICNRISELSVDMVLEYYDFERDKWQEVKGVISRGLFRQKPNYGPYRYFIVDRYHYGKTYELLDKEWTYILAHEILNQEIPIKYCTATKQGQITPRHFFRFPSLLKRILISDSLVFPEYQKGYFMLENIDKKRLNRLGDKIKSLRLIML